MDLIHFHLAHWIRLLRTGLNPHFRLLNYHLNYSHFGNCLRRRHHPRRRRHHPRRRRLHPHRRRLHPRLRHPRHRRRLHPRLRHPRHRHHPHRRRHHPHRRRHLFHTPRILNPHRSLRIRSEWT